MAMKRFSLFGLVAGGALLLAGCGHSDEEMAAKQREIDKLGADLRAAKTQMDQDGKKFNDAQAEIDGMKAELKKAGVDLETTAADKAKLQDAVAQYKQRAEQLAEIERRFGALRAKLEQLAKTSGLRVAVRNNRMVIQLPGDILFDSGKDELKPGGRAVLGQVADVIRTDTDLASRMFQVAGHTDNAKYGGGPFHDNWGLSLARSRQVLLFLVTPNTAPGGAKPPPAKPAEVLGGGLDPKKWAASGYGETDPVSGTVENQSKDEQGKNRRVELVVQPNVDEMISLGKIK